MIPPVPRRDSRCEAPVSLRWSRAFTFWTYKCSDLAAESLIRLFPTFSFGPQTHFFSPPNDGQWNPELRHSPRRLPTFTWRFTAPGRPSRLLLTGLKSVGVGWCHEPLRANQNESSPGIWQWRTRPGGGSLVTEDLMQRKTFLNVASFQVCYLISPKNGKNNY